MKKAVKSSTNAAKKYKVHPLADLFPMLNEDELNDLADDIAANGLLHPIVTDSKSQVIDGRNRLAACDIAGVEPRFEIFEGEDVRSFILSNNIHRRHMNKGQRAMAVAMMYPESEQGKKKSTSLQSKEVGFSEALLSKARLVLRTLEPGKADAVLAGALSLGDAYEEAKSKDRAADPEKQLRELRRRSPELADRVENEELTLEEAEQKVVEEAEALRKHRVATTTNLVTALDNLSGEPKYAKEVFEDFDEAIAEQISMSNTVSMIKRIRRAIEYLTALEEQWNNQHSRTRTKGRANQVD